MSAPRTLAEAQAACRAAGVDLRVSGRGMTTCMDLLAPFCPPGSTLSADIEHELPRCVGPNLSPEKAAILLSEAQARSSASSGPPWLLIGGAAIAGGVALWLWLR